MLPGMRLSQRFENYFKFVHLTLYAFNMSWENVALNFELMSFHCTVYLYLKLPVYTNLNCSIVLWVSNNLKNEKTF